MSIRKCFSRPAYALPDTKPALRPLFKAGTTPEQWQQSLRPQLLANWQQLIGHPATEPQLPPPPVAAELCQTFDGEGFTAEVYKQPTGFGQEQTLIVLHPQIPATGAAASGSAAGVANGGVTVASGVVANGSNGVGGAANDSAVDAANGSAVGAAKSVATGQGETKATPGRFPAAVVPFYFAERSAGFVIGGAARGATLSVDKEMAEVVPLGLHLVRLGLTVVCVEAFPFNTVPRPPQMDTSDDPFLWWRSGAQQLLAEHPQWTGLGRLIHDTRRAVDLLLQFPQVDPQRVLAMGHSLGGKMAFFTTAMEPRISAVIGSDFGLPWRSTNWDDPWYLGDRVPPEDTEAALHEVLALIAPRPFFLIAGETDARSSWHCLEAARSVYDLYGAGDSLGCIDHSSGHAPAIAALEVAYGWLAETFGLPHRRWRK